MSICNNCCFGFPELLHESKVFFFLREYSSFKTHFQLFSKNDYFLKTFFRFCVSYWSFIQWWWKHFALTHPQLIWKVDIRLATTRWPSSHVTGQNALNPNPKSSAESFLDFIFGFVGYEVESSRLNMFCYGLHLFSWLKVCVCLSD